MCVLGGGDQNFFGGVRGGPVFCKGVGLFDTERGDHNFLNVRKGEEIFLLPSKAGPEKIGDGLSQLDAPLLVKNDSSLT